MFLEILSIKAVLSIQLLECVYIIGLQAEYVHSACKKVLLQFLNVSNK